MNWTPKSTGINRINDLLSSEVVSHRHRRLHLRSGSQTRVTVLVD